MTNKGCPYQDKCVNYEQGFPDKVDDHTLITFLKYIIDCKYQDFTKNKCFNYSETLDELLD